MGALVPHVLELLDDGYAQAVVVCHTSELESAKEARLTKLIDDASPSAAVIRAARGPRPAGATLAALVLPSSGPSTAATAAPFYSAAMSAATAFGSS